MRRYILSAGRTGTVYLTQLLNQMDGVMAEHEPPPSRYQMMLANARNDIGLGDSVLRYWFSMTRQKDRRTPPVYVELNPFLCALADLIPDARVETRVVHMIRNPRDWARSMTLFKASKRYRNIIDYVPFSKPYPAPRPEKWGRLPDVEKALWRWRWCNEKILRLESCVDYFATIRSEDLFSNALDTRTGAANHLFECLGIPGHFPVDFHASGEGKNQSPGGKVVEAPSALNRICGPLSERFGYAP